MVEKDAECVREDVFAAYRDYCFKNGMKPMSQATFNKEVEGSNNFVTKAHDRLGKRRTWRGLRLQE